MRPGGSGFGAPLEEPDELQPAATIEMASAAQSKIVRIECSFTAV
jgi:hypothetical protein